MKRVHLKILKWTTKVKRSLHFGRVSLWLANCSLSPSPPFFSISHHPLRPRCPRRPGSQTAASNDSPVFRRFVLIGPRLPRRRHRLRVLKVWHHNRWDGEPIKEKHMKSTLAGAFCGFTVWDWGPPFRSLWRHLWRQLKNYAITHTQTQVSWGMILFAIVPSTRHCWNALL